MGPAARSACCRSAGSTTPSPSRSEPGVILCTYGDLLRVPGSERLSLLKAKAEGADVRMVYSAARQPQDRPATIRTSRWCSSPSASRPPRRRPPWCIKQAQAQGLANFSVFCNHVLTPAAIANILESPEVRELGTVPLDGFIGPAHVSTVIGSRPYEFFAEEYRKPVVIAGFEPLDVMQAILMLVRQVNDGRAEVENEFSPRRHPRRQPEGQALVAEVFELRSVFEWRGLGWCPTARWRIKAAFAAWDAERRFAVRDGAGARQQGLRMRRHPARRQAARRLQAVRHRLHAGKSHGLLHGVGRRRLRRPLDLRPFPR